VELAAVRRLPIKRHPSISKTAWTHFLLVTTASPKGANPSEKFSRCKDRASTSGREFTPNLRLDDISELTALSFSDTSDSAIPKLKTTPVVFSYLPSIFNGTVKVTDYSAATYHG